LNNRVRFFISDIDNFIIGKYDIVVSNPPYIKKHKLKYLDRSIVKFEPKLALDGGLDGLFKINKVINKSKYLLKKNGKLFLEIGFDQKHEVTKILKEKGFFINNILKDYGYNYRCVICTKI
jgi:release factor glutamine methyltransferase